MYTQQGRMLESLENVQHYLGEHADTLGTVIATGTRKELDDAIVELAAHVADQAGNVLIAQGATHKQRALRHALLHDHMVPIARIAKKHLPRTPELAPLRMPRDKLAVKRLVAAAQGMAEAAAPVADVFVAAGEPADFIARLNQAADALVESVKAREQSRTRCTSATNGLKAKLSAGRQIVHILDAFIQTALKDHPSQLAGWNAVKRVKKVGTRSTTIAGPATTTAASTTHQETR